MKLSPQNRGKLKENFPGGDMPPDPPSGSYEIALGQNQQGRRLYTTHYAEAPNEWFR